MQDTNWGPWIDWTGGEPPVPNGTLIEALVMVRVQDLHRAKLPHFNHIIFRTGNGDSFRLKPLINNPKECLTLVYRYRAWQDGSTIHSEMPAEEADALEAVLP